MPVTAPVTIVEVTTLGRATGVHP
ncbi:MAG: hypothetical protein QOH62_2592, partial [Solirubrobacteraceae bacterium]|nr:hypothetical protein [Solirubrobacteraceae bacterium]